MDLAAPLGPRPTKAYVNKARTKCIAPTPIKVDVSPRRGPVAKSGRAGLPARSALPACPRAALDAYLVSAPPARRRARWSPRCT